MKNLRHAMIVGVLVSVAVAAIGSAGVWQAPFSAEAASPAASSSVAPAREPWKGEFEDLCSKTDEAASLSAAELRELIARADRLKPRIESADETVRKVSLRRLQMCRDLYQYLLELKEKE